MKSKFLEALDRVVKEMDGPYTQAAVGSGGATQDPEQAAAAAAGAAQQAGTKEKDALNAANKAFLAAVQTHPLLKGDLNKLDTNFIKSLQTTK
jgi:hypothetical protein